MKRNTWLKPVALLVIIFALFQSGKTRRQDFYIRIYQMQDGVRGALVKSVEGPLRKADDYAPQINELEMCIRDSFSTPFPSEGVRERRSVRPTVRCHAQARRQTGVYPP